MIHEAEMVPDLEALRVKIEHVEDLVTPPVSEPEPRKAASASVATRRMAWYRGVEDAVLDLSNAMPEGVEDYDVRKLLESLVELRRMLDADPEAHDPRGEIELVTMQTADVVRRIRRRLLHQRLDDPQIAVDFILRNLTGIPISELATLLGVSTKTITAWRSGGAVRQNTRRVVVIAQTVAQLRGSMSPRGVVMWFDAERDQLGNRTPLEVLGREEAASYSTLVDLARGGRGQLAG